MISYYQPHLLPFLSYHKLNLPNHVSRFHYLSWEDALWDILPQLGVRPGHTILLPDFYCLDVLVNIKLHGYKVQNYPLDHNFQVSAKVLLNLYNRIKPAVVIIFHAGGITSNIIRNQRLVDKLTRESVLIEDLVHKIVDPSKIHKLHGRHLLMDSLRKNLPLPGAFAYMSNELGTKISPPKINSPLYVLRVALFYYLYRTFLSLGSLFRNPILVAFAHNKVLMIHDEVVGDSQQGNQGLPWVPFVHSFIDYSKIRNHKTNQVKVYLILTKHLPSISKLVYVPFISKEDMGELRAFPLVISGALASTVEKALNPINVWTQFGDSIWSQEKKAFHLPLGFHITRKDQENIVSIISQIVQKTV